MCEALDVNHDVLAKRNHKGLAVEYFNRFFNKDVVITASVVLTKFAFLLETLLATL